MKRALKDEQLKADLMFSTDEGKNPIAIKKVITCETPGNRRATLSATIVPSFLFTPCGHNTSISKTSFRGPHNGYNISNKFGPGKILTP